MQKNEKLSDCNIDDFVILLLTEWSCCVTAWYDSPFLFIQPMALIFTGSASVFGRASHFA